MNPELLKTEIVPKYLSSGEQKFYKFLIFYALNQIIFIKQNDYNGLTPEVELLNSYDKFITLYRREGDDTYLQIARVFRKAAHKIYRVSLKQGLIDRNSKFLNLV